MCYFDAPLLKPVTFKQPESVWQQIKNWRFDRRRWQLQSDWIFWCDHVQLYIKIPAKFTCDGASVPHFLKFIVSSCDGLFYGAILHDFIYRFDQLIVCPSNGNGTCSKEWRIWENPGKRLADELLYQLPKQVEGFKLPNSIAYILKPTYYYAWKFWRKINYKLDSTSPNPDDEGLTSLL